MTNNFFNLVQVVPGIGQMHNAQCIEFFNANEAAIKTTTNVFQRRDIILNYYHNIHNRDVSPYITPFMKGADNSPPLSAMDIVNNAKRNLSPYFHYKLVSLLHETQAVANNKSEFFNIIETYETSLSNDNKYWKNEKEAFTNILDVFRSSYEFWLDYDLAPISNGAIGRINGDNAWKIAAADWSGAVFGGLLGGPGGALLGWIGASVQSVISLW